MGPLRILLDNCIPADLVPHIRGHEVSTAVDMGWAGLDDGLLLDAMADQFDVLVTVDTNMRFQQRLEDRQISVVVLRAKSNRVEHLARLVPALHRWLKNIELGEIREISS